MAWARQRPERDLIYAVNPLIFCFEDKMEAGCGLAHLKRRYFGVHIQHVSDAKFSRRLDSLCWTRYARNAQFTPVSHRLHVIFIQIKRWNAAVQD